MGRMGGGLCTGAMAQSPLMAEPGLSRSLRPKRGSGLEATSQVVSQWNGEQSNLLSLPGGPSVGGHMGQESQGW